MPRQTLNANQNLNLEFRESRVQIPLVTLRQRISSEQYHALVGAFALNPPKTKIKG